MNLGHSEEIDFENLGVAVAGQVGKDQLVPSYRAWLSQREEVDGACASWRRGDLGCLFADQRIEQARFADVRTPKESDLRRAGLRELSGVHGREQELCLIAHRD